MKVITKVQDYKFERNPVQYENMNYRFEIVWNKCDNPDGEVFTIDVVDFEVDNGVYLLVLDNVLKDAQIMSVPLTSVFYMVCTPIIHPLDAIEPDIDEPNLED